MFSMVMVPAKFSVANVYADVGQIFASTLVAQPRVAAYIMGVLVKGMGADRVLWGTDALWTGSPQWQIEGLRRLEIPVEMQKTFGFKPLGAADGPVKTAIFSGNSIRLYNFERDKIVLLEKPDKIAVARAKYEEAGPERSNLRYGYIAKPV